MMRKFLLRHLDDLFSRWVRIDSLILNQWAGKMKPTEPQSKRSRTLCLFAHFDPQNQIDPYVQTLVKSLMDLDADLIFITGSENIPPREIEKISPYCIQILQKKNRGLDFGSWRVALHWIAKSQLISLENYDTLIFANDSVYGPIFPLSESFQKMQSQGFDFWAMSSTPEVEYHLQSFFWVMNRKVLRSPAFHDFWKYFRYYYSKWRIIQNYEIGFTTLAQQQGWKTGAFLEHREVERSDLNPTLFSWEELIEKHRFPFLKTEVLKLNRGKSHRIRDWQDIIRKNSTYDTRLILNYLIRLGVKIPHEKEKSASQRSQ